MIDLQDKTTIIVLVVLGVLIITLLALVVSRVVLHLMKRPLEDRIAAEYKPDEILMKDLKANSFGLESAGIFQLRGNGGLVLTAKQLHFFMFIPKRNLCVPLDAISEVTFTRSHLGKATIYNLLKVHFSAEGKMDSIALYLTDPPAWKNKIDTLKAGGPTRQVINTFANPR